MGLGGYLAGKTEQEHFQSEHKWESDEVERVLEREKEEVRELLAEYGLSETIQYLVADEFANNKKIGSILWSVLNQV